MQHQDEELPELIFAYTRSDAIRDGVLVEVSEALLKEAGIRYHTAITCVLWHDVIVPDAESLATGQSVEGRLWDVLMVFRVLAKQTSDSVLLFQVRFLFNGCEHRDIQIKAVYGPGDDLSPCITLMHEWED